MTDPYRAGNVWLVHVDFEQGRGEEAKFIVVLSDLPEGATKDPPVGAFATSNGKWYPGMSTAPCGCPRNSCFRIDAGQEKCFAYDTYVQFDNAYAITRTGLNDAVKQGRAKHIQELKDQRVRALLKCALQSRDLSGKQEAVIQAAFDALPAPPAPPTKKPVIVSAPAPFRSVEILSLQVRVNARCDTCKNTLVEMMAGVDFLSIMAGSKPAPSSFIGDVDAGLEVLSDCACATKK